MEGFQLPLTLSFCGEFKKEYIFSSWQMLQNV